MSRWAVGVPPCGPATASGPTGRCAKEAAQRLPVLTWDYSVTEGEGTVALSFERIPDTQ